MAATYSRTSIMNLALSECTAGPITSENEDSLAARECRRWFDHVLGKLIELHDWGFGRARAQLAEVANDRPAAWPYAYAAPANMAYPLEILPPQTDVAASPAIYGQTLAPYPYQGPSVFPMPPEIQYEIDGDVIYTVLPYAVLSYVRSDIETAKFPPSFIDALALHLAARIAKPLTKSDSKAAQLETRAEVYLARAQAANLNRQPNTYGDQAPETYMVR